VTSEGGPDPKVTLPEVYRDAELPLTSSSENFVTLRRGGAPHTKPEH
jgi:hypothetical protein